MHKLLRDERGQVMVETAIAFPVQLLVTVMLMQLCLIAVGKQMVNYAAHAAARAVLVGLDPHQAASIACSPVAGSYVPDNAPPPIHIPGRGNLGRSRQSQAKTFIPPPAPSGANPDLIPSANPLDDGDKKVAVTVVHYFELMLPFVNATPFADWHPIWGKIVKLGPKGVVHKVIVQTASLPQPWDGDLEGVTGHPIIPDLDADSDG
jgi:Flp pilus assembly protein TadG